MKVFGVLANIKGISFNRKIEILNVEFKGDFILKNFSSQTKPLTNNRKNGGISKIGI